jgi:hypothetical protein
METFRAAYCLRIPAGLCTVPKTQKIIHFLSFVSFRTRDARVNGKRTGTLGIVTMFYQDRGL